MPQGSHPFGPQTMRKKDPSYDDLNSVISKVMSGITTPFRFPGQLNS